MGSFRRAIVALALLVGGCTHQAGQATEFDASEVNQLRQGVSTEADAIALLGEPTKQGMSPIGEDSLQWFYGGGPTVAHGGVLVALFKDGLMTRSVNVVQTGR